VDLSTRPNAILITPNDPNFPRPSAWDPRLCDAQSYDWAPCFGFAYRALGQTVLRGGGRFFAFRSEVAGVVCSPSREVAMNTAGPHLQVDTFQERVQ